MCGKSRNDIDEEEDLASMDDIEEEKACARPARVLLFIMNFIIWLGSCALLALGIYALVDAPFTKDVLPGNSLMILAVALIVIGGIGFVISFVGCCGAFLKNKCLVMTYVIILIILLAAMLIAGILGFLHATKINGLAVEQLRKSMIKYDKTDSNNRTTLGWDIMQRSIKCCGVMSYKNWGEYNSGFTGNQVPKSCCVIDSTSQQPRNGCESGNNQNDIYSDAGCHGKIIRLLDEKSPYVAIVGAIVAFCMVLGVILGLVAYSRW